MQGKVLTRTLGQAIILQPQTKTARKNKNNYQIKNR